MRRFRMPVFASCLFLSVLLTGSSRAEEPAPLLLASTGLPAGTPEQVLPAGAVVHLRAHNLGMLLKSLDQLIVSFVPEKALPPQLQQLLEQPMPVLNFIGLNPMGQPLSVGQLGTRLGVALEKPITLSFYAAHPRNGFILSVPIKDSEILTGLICNAMDGKLDLVQGVNGKAYEVVGQNPELPQHVFICCSEDRAFICGSVAIAEKLSDTKGTPRLDSSDLIKRSVVQHEKESFTALIDPSFFKPVAAMFLQAFAKLPPQKVRQLREQILASIPPEKKAEINFRLRWQLGIASVEQGLDYAEAVATTTYEVLFASFAEQVMALDGLALSVDVGNPTQKIRVQLFSKAINPAGSTQPIPLAEVREALTKIPGSRNVVAIVGRESKTLPCASATKWFDLLKVRLAEKNLPADGLAKFATYMQGSLVTQPLGSSVPWTIATQASAVATDNVAPKTLMEYWTSLASPSRAPLLTVMPAQAEDVIEKHYKDEANNKNANEKSYLQYHALDAAKPFCQTSARCQVSAVNAALKKVVYENTYTSNTGYFGYSEHEFTNRKILYYTQQGNYYFMQQGFGTETPWIASLDKVPAVPLAPALTKLLDQVPADAVSLHTFRILNEIPAIVSELSKLEDVVHVELNTYLNQAQKVLIETGKDKEKLQTKLFDINPPMTMMALNLDAASGKLYGVLPGNLRFPRPKVMPILTALLKDFSAQADTHGGMVSYTRVANGEYELSVSVNTDALALLVKTTVNAAFETYVNDPAGNAKLQGVLRVQGDGKFNRDEVLLFNPIWEMLKQGASSLRARREPGAVREQGVLPPAPKKDDGTF